MPLTKERIEISEIILITGSGSCHKVAIDFNGKHSKQITHNTVKLGMKAGEEMTVFVYKEMSIIWRMFCKLSKILLKGVNFNV